MPSNNCQSCGHLSPPDSHFCTNCGAALPLVCRDCGADILAGGKFCPACGSSLARPQPVVESAADRPASPQPPAAPSLSNETERRLVTAVFCDLVGFTPLSERLDPEEVRDIQADYFEAMSAQVVKFGGTVEKYAGDAVLALFGAPVAHEDDPERAVLCALGMQEAIAPVAGRVTQRWQAEPSIRIGVNTGEVVSGAWTASSRQDVAVSGDAVNVAARLQAAAEAGEVLVGAETRQMTRRRIRYGERRDVKLKGKSGTIPVWPAIGLREEFGERWEGYETPLIGRDREMVQMLDSWVRAQGGEGQLISVVGEAGVGKSRLITEFLGKVASAAAVRVVRARSLSYGQGISLWLLADLLRSVFGIKEEDTLDAIAGTLKAAIPVLVPEDPVAAEALDVLGEVLGVPRAESPVTLAGPQIRHRALLRCLRVVLAAIAQRAPTILVLEDLHWIDSASQEVLSEILPDVLGLRMLVVVAQRPGWTAPWTEWGWPERVTLRPLPEAESAQLAGEVLGGVTLSTELELYVGERAGGNPFFLEEIIRALRDSGGIEPRAGQMVLLADAAERLPATLTGVLLARLDRLDPRSRTVAQVASVIGRTFPLKLLTRVAETEPTELDDSLSTLQRAEIAFPRRGADVEYVFKHVSMRDAAYNTMVRPRRQELHLRTAQAISQLYPAEEYAGMIAYHYSSAGAPEALEWHERAGDRAADIYAGEAAIQAYGAARQGLEEAGASPLTLARLDEKLGTVLMNLGQYDDGLDSLERAAAVRLENRDLDATGRLVAQIGMAHRYRGTLAEGIERVTPMVDVLTPGGPSHSLCSLHLALANLLLLDGRYLDVLHEAEKAAAIARVTGSERQLGEAEERRGTALHLLNRPEGRDVLEAAIPLIERGGDLIVLFRAFNNAGEGAKIDGDMPAARRFSERGLEVAERVGNPDQICFILGNLAAISCIDGQWEMAAEFLDRAHSYRDLGFASGFQAPLPIAARLALWRGQWEEAERLLEESRGMVYRLNDQQFTEEVVSALGELYVVTGRPEEAVRVLESHGGPSEILHTTGAVLAWAHLKTGDLAAAIRCASESVAEARGERLRLVDALRVQAMVLIAQKSEDAAFSLVQEASEFARSMPYPYAEARLHVLAAQILERQGRPAEAAIRLGAGLDIFRRLGARRNVEALERLKEATDGTIESTEDAMSLLARHTSTP